MTNIDGLLSFKNAYHLFDFFEGLFVVKKSIESLKIWIVDCLFFLVFAVQVYIKEIDNPIVPQVDVLGLFNLDIPSASQLVLDD